MGNQTKVHILKREYVLSGDLNPDYIRQLAQKIDDRLTDIKKAMGGKSDDLHLLILLAMNLMDEVELFHEKSQNPSEDEIFKKTNRLISMLEKGIVGDDS